MIILVIPKKPNCIAKCDVPSWIVPKTRSSSVKHLWDVNTELALNNCKEKIPFPCGSQYFCEKDKNKKKEELGWKKYIYFKSPA